MKWNLFALVGPLSLFVVLAGFDRGAAAADRIPGVSRMGKPVAGDETVELFSAIAKGQIAVRLIPRNAKQCRAFVENKTDRPLNVQFPEAFAGVPVLAQFGPDFAPGQNRPPGQQPSQQIGGPMNNPLGNQPPLGNGPMNPGSGPRPFNPFPNLGPLFNVKPEMIGQIELTTVCLDHGKPDPRPRIPYEIRPIEKVAAKPAVAEICRLIGRKGVNRGAAQAAAWHLSNGKTWEELAAMKTSKYVPVDPVFSKTQLKQAKELVEEANRLAKQRQEHRAKEKNVSSACDGVR